MEDRVHHVAEIHRSPRATGLALVLMLLPLVPTQVLGQQGVLGELLDQETGAPVATAQVELLDAEGQVVGQTLSDRDGIFFIPSELGTYSVVVSRLGYAPINVGDVEITDSSVLLPVRILLSPDALELPGLVVEGEQRVRYLELNGFYQRQRMGFGHQLKIERDRMLQTLEPSDFVRRMPGVIVSSGGRVRKTRGTALGGLCLMQVMVDGIYRGVDLDDALVARDIEAVELYTRASDVPGQWQSLAFMGYLDPTGRKIPTCGIIVVWTRH